MTQLEFEQLIGRQEAPPDVELPPFTVIYFTATWCSACRALNIPALEAAIPNINWLKCDVDQNNYTPGFCGIRAIPTFLIVKNKKIVDTLKSTNNDYVEKWIRTHM